LTPPQSPGHFSSPTLSPTTTPRRHSITSFFRTARQRKLDKIREGKLPDTECDVDNSTSQSDATPVDDEPADDESFPMDEIIDPSSSSTYNPKNRKKLATETNEFEEAINTSLSLLM
jgi:hypothetical protein